eukprot:477478-Prorocentrum_minimum.AAC.1
MSGDKGKEKEWEVPSGSGSRGRGRGSRAPEDDNGQTENSRGGRSGPSGRSRGRFGGRGQSRGRPLSNMEMGNAGPILRSLAASACHLREVLTFEIAR